MYLVEQGFRVALFDWELSGEDHKVRLARLFPDGMPRIDYKRIDRPLVHVVDQLRREVADKHIDYALFDSVAYGCDGPPEAAESAGRYFRAVRQMGIGSLHIAHINRSENGDQKPFGSVFWWNSARSVWFTKRADDSGESDIFDIGFFPRKHNLGRRPKPIAFTVTFDGQNHRVTFATTNPVDTSEFAAKMSVADRMAGLLRKGPMTAGEIATKIAAKKDTVEKTVRRRKNLFVMLDNGEIGLLNRRGI
jgi:hypothetical protein